MLTGVVAHYGVIKALFNLDVDNCAVVISDWTDEPHIVDPKGSEPNTDHDASNELDKVHQMLIAHANGLGWSWTTIAPPMSASGQLF